MMEEIGEEAAAEIQTQAIEREICATDFSKASAKLAEGLLTIYQPPLEQIEKELNELTRKQQSILDQLLVENNKLKATADDAKLTEMFSTIKLYQGKLSLVKKEMTDIHERTSKLKKRAVRLQQRKQKEALHKEHQREQELRREQELIGKPSVI